MLEPDSLHLECSLVHLKKEAVLVLGFGLDQGCLHGTARLKEVNAVLVAFKDLRYRLVFMCPDDEMKELRHHAFGDGVAP